MRPHALSVTAFGPFAGTVEVDLDVLAGQGLFLLRGDTGAGKTTLLDALGFALYGQVPGVRQRTRRLRSDHAPDGVRTSVRLEVTLGGRRLRITRSPQQERRKARGEGTTTEPAKVLLEQLVDGCWATVSTRIDEAAAELDPLLGMSASQFFQVVLLPQGEFAQFLRADSSARAELLERLFGTARFGAVEEWLEARRRDSARAVAAASAAVADGRARVEQAAGGAAPEPEEDLAAWAQGERAAATALAGERADVVEEVTGRQRTARAALEQARDLGGRQQQRAELLSRAERLAAARPAEAALEAELAAAERAAGLAAARAEARERSEVHAAALDREAASRAELVAAGLPAGLGPEELTAHAAQARERTGRLEGLEDVAATLDDERRQVEEAIADQAAATALLARSADRLEGLAAERAGAEARLAAARAASDALTGARAEQAEVAALLEAQQGRRGAAADVARLVAEVLSAREAAVELAEEAQRVREARFEANVHELASLLVDGDPCMVCGSPTHPEPSEVRGERVGREQEEAARRAADAATRVVTRLTAEHAAAVAVERGYADRLAGVQVDGLAARLAALQGRVQALAADAAGEAAVGQALRALDAERTALETARAQATAERAAARRRCDEANARAETAAGLLRAELGDDLDLPAAVARAERVAVVCTGVLAAVAELARARQEADRADASLARAVAASGFADLAAVEVAARPDGWSAATRERLRVAGAEAAAVASGLADARLDVPLAPPADVAGAAGALDRVDAELAAAQAELATATARRAALDELVPALLRALAALAPRQDEAALVRRLADLCAGGGQNSLRMSLTSFVLAARLEEVAAQASSRLLPMTQGRYSLVHTDGAVRGGGRSGLGLLARDTWTGQDRDTSTLSGGETFLASLALALGLADVVQAEAGGARLEALFVDEGFGSLDEETLDEVMDVLDGLREGGRVVGLVSHVAELHARIPAQVHVRKGRAGSDLVLVGC